MRVMTMEFAESVARKNSEKVKINIQRYNSLSTTRVKAKKVGTRRPRCADEARILESFSLK